MVHERLLYLGFAARVGGADEVEQVRVFEKLRGHVALRRRHGEGEVVHGFSRAEVELALDLDLQNAAAPAVDDGFADVELAGSGGFEPLHDLENVPPRQLRNRLLRNWAFRKFAGEDFHR